MKKTLLIPLVFATLLLTSCNTPPPGDPSPGPDIMTAAAQTVQAALTPEASPTAPTVPSRTGTATAAPITPSLTPNYDADDHAHIFGADDEDHWKHQLPHRARREL